MTALHGQEFSTVYEAELEYVRKRRGKEPQQNDIQDNLIGLALSGGGIRSATTNLGILQALSKLEILPLVDFLSRVTKLFPTRRLPISFSTTPNLNRIAP